MDAAAAAAADRPLRRALLRGVAAVRANLVPGLILNAVAAAVGAAYAWHPGTREVFERVAVVKGHAPWIFAMCSTMLFGGLLPVVLQRLGAARREPWRYLVFLLPFWAYKGLEVNALYALQAWLFGLEPSAGVVALKVAADQLVYVTVWATPSQVLVYQWMDAGFRVGPVRADLARGRYYLRQCVPVLVTNWALWTPAVAILYQLPLELQLPFQNLILCLWVLLLSFLSKPGDALHDHPEQAAG